MRLGLGIDEFRRFVVELERTLGDEIERALDEFGERLGALLERGDGGGELVPAGCFAKRSRVVLPS